MHRENQLIENFVGRVSQSHVIVCPLCYERLRDDFIGDFGGRASADPDPISVILSRDISSVTSYMFRTRVCALFLFFFISLSSFLPFFFIRYFLFFF